MLVQAKLDFKDVQILEAIGKHGPRNLAEVSRKLEIPEGTLRSRLRHLASHFFVRFNLNIYHTNLGLKKAMVFAEVTPGYENLVLDCLKANGFWIYMTRCYGKYEGCVSVYTIPKGHESEFKRFIKEIENLGVIRTTRIFWSTCFQTVNPTSQWFDGQSNTWVFQWDKWIDEIINEETHLPRTLRDPEDFVLNADYTDIFILKELEKNARTSFVEIAKKLNMDRRTIEYHYRNHVLKRGLIEGFKVTTFHFDLRISDWIYFILKFQSKDKLAKFARSLLDKSFASTIGKVLGENMLVTLLYLPRSEFRKFIDCLATLVKKDFLLDYEYTFLDLKEYAQQTLSYEFFKDKSWSYSHKENMKKLHEITGLRPQMRERNERVVSEEVTVC